MCQYQNNIDAILDHRIQNACLAVLLQHRIHTAQQVAIQGNMKPVWQYCIRIVSILRYRMLSRVTGSLYTSIVSALHPYCAAGCHPA